MTETGVVSSPPVAALRAMPDAVALRPHPEERPLGRVSKDGREPMRGVHPSRRPRSLLYDVGQHRSPDGAQRNPGLTRRRPRIALRSIRTTAARGRVVICPLSSLFLIFRKIFSVPTHPKSNLELSPSHPTRGAYHDRHGRGEGCGGRSSVGRAMRAQGGLLSVSG